MNDLRPNINQPHQNLSVAASAQTLAQCGLSLHADTKMMVFQVEGGDVRATVNGTDPTTTLGHLWPNGSMWKLGRSEAQALKLIRVSSPATVQVSAFLA